MDKEKTPFFKNFTRGYTFKVLMLMALVLLLLIPLNMIRSLVNERGHTAASAESDIMEAWGKQLIAAGPIVTIPGIRTEEVRTKTEKEGEKIEIIKTPFTLVISPQKLDIHAALKTETRKRGIFSVPLFSGTLGLSGVFDPAMAVSELLPNEEVFFNQAELIISLLSQKGIRTINALLLSLSEQLPFYTACLIAAFAVSAMMTLYSRSLLPSWNKLVHGFGSNHLIHPPLRSAERRILRPPHRFPGQLCGSGADHVPYPQTGLVQAGS
jgi:inner membrane protein involved in colicin E2 resistance